MPRLSDLKSMTAAATAKDEALAALRRGDTAAALAAATRAIAADADYAEGWAARGTARLIAGEALAAESDLAHALALKPILAEVHLNHAIALISLGRLDDAERSIVRARTLAPALPVDATFRQVLDLRRADFDRTHSREAGFRLVLALGAVDLLRDAETVADQCLTAFPRDAELWMVKADLALRQRRFPDAVAAARQAAAVQPDDPEPAVNVATVLFDSGDSAAATEVAARATEKFPHSELPWTKLADIVRDDSAKGWTAVKAAALTPDASAAALSRGLWSAAERVEWDLVDDLRARLARRLDEDSANPLRLCLHDMPMDVLRHNAERFSATRWPERRAIAPPPTAKAKLRIGYLSPDFRTHPIGFIMLDLLRHHDRNKVEVYAYAVGPASDSPERRAIVAAVDKFTILSELSDFDAAQKVRDDGIDILIDLAGHTRFTRLGILSFRPAPLQLHYLGFPGTVGARFNDYIVGDPWTIPLGSETNFTEAVMRLPRTYLVNSHRPDVVPGWDRARYGLTTRDIVLCAFHHPMKITRRMFDAWARIMVAVPDTVLWLLADQAAAKTNLLNEAAARGIAAQRIHFAPRADLPLHLARYAIADLMLDTTPYNGHATNADALWMGCPVLTLPGVTFASRVCAGLLDVIGLRDLIATDPDDYVRRAVALAGDRAALAALRAGLADVRQSILFDNATFAREFEAGLFAAWERRLAGLAPQTFDVAPVAAR